MTYPIHLLIWSRYGSHSLKYISLNFKKNISEADKKETTWYKGEKNLLKGMNASNICNRLCHRPTPVYHQAIYPM